ncbi:response regulator [Prosthecomicrobium sp. N25]|uniref:response regulator n=1 Tax=Prosthecomicrobium sp. N25 TaxID=3129254 RepID=UPI0030774AA3
MQEDERVPRVDRDTPPPGGAMRVLAVEDHEIGRRLLATLLESFGAACTVAGSAEEAVEAAGKSAYDVVLIDLGLPDGDGEGLARRLSGEAGTAGAALVAVTGRSRPDRLPSVFADWLVKPYSVRELYRTVLEARPALAAGA